ncbi:MAG: helix-turn-helix transcriptional regulator [Dongiaceae bacterium]
MGRLNERQVRWLLGGVGAGCFGLLMAMEIATQDEAVTLLDYAGDAISLFLTIGAATGSTLLLLRIQTQHEEQMALIGELEIARAEGNGWRTKVHSHLAGLKTEMNKQFEEWGMTDAERDVGLLILKGLSHKEIATLRKTSDATVRQQAQGIYRKAGLPGKTAFSAYFLEDLLASGDATNGHCGDESMEAPNGSSDAHHGNGHAGAARRHAGQIT